MSILKKIIFKISLPLVLLAVLSLSGAEPDTQMIVIDQSPGARWGHVFIYNPATKRILLYGGISKRGGSFLNDTWIWESGAWKRLDILSGDGMVINGKRWDRAVKEKSKQSADQ